MSIVIGYPRNTMDAQLDAAVEAEAERQWEEEQRNHDEAWNRMLEAVGYITPAIEQMEKAVKLLLKAKDEVDGLPAEYRLGSLIESFEELVCDFNNARQKFIEGEG